MAKPSRLDPLPTQPAVETAASAAPPVSLDTAWKKPAVSLDDAWKKPAFSLDDAWKSMGGVVASLGNQLSFDLVPLHLFTVIFHERHTWICKRMQKQGECLSYILLMLMKFEN